MYLIRFIFENDEDQGSAFCVVLERSIGTGGAVKCLDTLMEGMGDYRRVGDLHFEVICWNWKYCRFYLAIMKSF